MLFAGAGGGPHLPLVWDGDGCLPLFMSPHCMLTFAICGGCW